MPQAIERSLATPMTRPFLPAISCAADGHGLVLSGAGHWDKMPVVEGRRPLHIVVMIRETADPLALFADWYAEAAKSEPNDPTAMALATVGPDGMPSVRMVLLKDYDAAGFVFYTNYESRKGQHLLAHPKAAMLFHWKSLRRQVRLEGPVIADHAGGGRRLFRHPRARQPDRRLGLGPVAAAGEPLRAGKARGRVRRQAPRRARCRGRRIGRASACSRC